MASGHKMMTLLLVASVLVLLLSMVTAMAQAVSPAPAPVSDATSSAKFGLPLLSLFFLALGAFLY